MLGKDKLQDQSQEKEVTSKLKKTITLRAEPLANIRSETERFLRFLDALIVEVPDVNPGSNALVMARRSSQDLSRMLKDFRASLIGK
jgi:hypothetical protein